MLYVHQDLTEEVKFRSKYIEKECFRNWDILVGCYYLGDLIFVQPVDKCKKSFASKVTNNKEH